MDSFDLRSRQHLNEKLAREQAENPHPRHWFGRHGAIMGLVVVILVLAAFVFLSQPVNAAGIFGA